MRRLWRFGLAAVVVSACVAPAPAVAQTIRTWNATLGTWSDTGNWVTGTVAGVNDIAWFSATSGSDATVVLGANTSVLGLSFNSTGATTIRGDSTTARTLTIGGSGIWIAAGAGAVTNTGTRTTFQLNGDQTWTNNSSNLFTTGSVFIQSGTATLTIDGSGNTTIQNLGGGANRTLAVVKNGSGLLTLSNAATSFNGGITLNSGSLVMGSNGAFGTGTVAIMGSGVWLDNAAANANVFNNANVMIWGGDFTFVGTDNLNTRNIARLSGGNRTVNVSARTLTVAAIAEATAGLGFTKDGPGTLAISGSVQTNTFVASTYTGSTSILAGALQIGVGGTNGSLSSSGTFAISSGGLLSFNRTDDYGGVYSSRIMGSGSIQLASGTLALSNATSDYSGGSFLSAGSLLRFDNAAALGTGAVTFVGGAGLRSNASGTLPNGLVLNATGTFDSQTNDNTISGAVTGAQAFVKAGAGTLTLAGTNTYTGATTINAGTLAIGLAGQLAGTTGTHTGAISVASGAGFRYASSVTSTVSSVISGAGSVAVGGPGTLILTGSSTYTGPTDIAGGSLQLGAGSTTGALSASSAITGSAGGVLVFNRTNTITQGTDFSSSITGGLGLTKLGSGTLVLNAANAYTGTTTIAAGLLSLSGGDNRLATTAPITITGGTLALGNGSQTTSGAIVIQGGTITSGTLVSTGAAFDAQGGLVSAELAGGLGLAKTTIGTTILSGSNSYSGTTDIRAGTLQIGNNGTTGALNNAGTITGSAGATLAFNRTNAVTQGVDFSSSPITGGIGLTKLATGTVVLNAANTYTGATTITAGALEANNSQALGVGGNITFAGGRLRYTGSSAGIDFGSRIKNSTAAISLDLNGQNVTLSNIDATNGGGGLSWTGTTSALTLAGTNLYTGNTTLATNQLLNINSNNAISSGTLVISGVASFDNTSGTPVTVANNMNLSGGSPTFAGATNGSLTIAGTTTISGLAAYAARTVTVTSGTLTLGRIAATDPTFGFTKGGNNGTLVIANDADPSFQGVFLQNGGTTIVKSGSALGSGTINLSGGTLMGDAPSALAFGDVTANGDTTLSGSSSMTARSYVQSASVSLTNNIAAGRSLTFTGTTSLQEAGGVTSRTLTVLGSGSTVFNGPIVNGGASGAGSLTINASGGSVTLNGTNTYSGFTVLTAGTAVIGSNASAFGSGTVRFNGGAISSTGSMTLTNPLASGVAAAEGLRSLTYAGPGELYFSPASGTGNWSNTSTGTLAVLSGTLGLPTTTAQSNVDYVKTGAGTLLLTGTRTGWRNFTIEDGVARLATSGSFSSAMPTVSRGTLDLNGNSFAGGNFTLGSATLSSGTAALLTGSGTLSIRASAGADTTITLTSGQVAGFISGNVNLIQGNATVGSFLLVNEVTNAAPDLVISANLTSSGSAGGLGAIFKRAAGTLALSGTNSYSELAIGAGVVRIDNDASLVSSATLTISSTGGSAEAMLGLNTATNFTRSSGTGAGQVSLVNAAGFAGYGGQTRIVNLGGAGATVTWRSGGFFETSGSGTFVLGSADADGTVDFRNPIALGVSGTTRVLKANRGSAAVDGILSGALSGGGGFRKIGDGILALTAANTYTGTTNVAAGTLRVGNGGATGSLGAASAVTGSSGATLAFNRSDTVTYSGTVGGSLNLTQLGPGTIILNRNHTYTGATTIASGTLQLGDGGTTGGLATASQITGSAGATLAFNRSDAVTQGTDFSAAAITGGLGLTKLGSGTLELNQANTFSGMTTITEGMLRLSGGDDRLGTTAPLRVNGGILDIGDGSQSTSGAIEIVSGTIQSGTLRNLGAVAFNAQAGTVSAILAGTPGLTKTTTGTLVLTAANTYAGTTDIQAGRLEIGNGGTTGALSASSPITGSAGATLVFNRSNTVTQGTDFSAAAITGGLGLTKLGSGTLVLNAANSYTGATQIAAGRLEIGDGGTTGGLAASSSITGSAGATLAFNRSNTVTQGTDFSAAAITGGLGLTKLNSGTLVLNAANTYTGTTSIVAGAIRVEGSGQLQSSARIDVASGATLVFDRTDDYGGAYNGKLAGAGLLRVEQGSLNITGVNAFTGTTTVLSGAVLDLDGRIDNTAMFVNQGATLMGTGSSGGLTTIAGVHNPGSSPGIQRFDSLTYESTAIVNWELWRNVETGPGTNFDQVLLSGSLTFDPATTFNLVFDAPGGSEVDWNNSFWDSNREWLIYNRVPDYLPQLQSNYYDAGGVFLWDVHNAFFKLSKGTRNSQTGVFLIYRVPEPSTYVLAGIGLAAAAAMRRRLRRGRPGA